MPSGQPARRRRYENAMRNLSQLGFAVGLLLLAIPATATDLAILHNGFSVRHERRENLGAKTRLYLSAGNSSYVDIATDQIERFEKDKAPPVAPAASSAPLLLLWLSFLNVSLPQTSRHPQSHRI